MNNDKLYNYFLASNADIVQLECLEFKHSSFSQIYRIVRNATNGVTVRHETGEEVFYSYIPLSLSLTGLRNDLDFSLNINLGDLGEIMNREFQNLRVTDTFKIKPKLVYRAYRSDDLLNPLIGPLSLQISSLNFNKEGTTFEASAQRLGINKTGEAYTTDRFTGLKGFL